MVIRGYTEYISARCISEVSMGAYHVLHDINTQRTRIIGHWNPDAEANKHDYGRDAKDEHIFLAMSEKVCGLAHDMNHWMK
jgi:hypothetical protein